MRRRRAGAALLVAALAVLLLAQAAGGQQGSKKKEREKARIGSRWRQPPPPPGADGKIDLFHRKSEGHDPLLWEDDELVRIRQLHARSFEDEAEYQRAPSLAAYLGLGAVDQIHMPLPLHIVFVGFEGDGNHKVKLDEETLTAWFREIDHLLPHARVALADLTCEDDGHCAGQVEGTVAPSPLPAHVRLNFSCNVVVVQRAEVLETYERAINVFSRPVDPDDETGARQVDALKLERFIDSFVEGLGLGGGYSVIVVNPKWSEAAVTYGFRAGFSADEVSALQEEVQHMRSLSLSHWEGEPAPPSGHAFGGGGMFMGAWGHRSRKFSVSKLQAESSAWVRGAQTYLAAEEDYRRRLLQAIGPKKKAALTITRAVAMLRKRGKSEMGALLAAMVTLPIEHFHNPRWRASHPLEDCLTPVWAGHGRWLLLDLTAQRSDWGPALGGDGVVVPDTIPSVSELFAEVAEAREAAREERADDEAEGALVDKLQETVQERTAAMRQQQAHAAQIHRAVQGVAPGGEPNDPGDETAEEMAARHQEALLHAELDVYEEFALKHCNGRKTPPLACHEAQQQVQDIRHELQSLTALSTSRQRTYREHHWDIFGLDDGGDGNKEVADAHARAQEHFLGALSDIISHGLRHVVAPPSATWHHEGYLHDTASPYAHRVHFTITAVQDNSRKLGDFRARGVSFDVERYKEQVSRLALPHQSFSFSFTEINLLDDPPLAAAFAVSLRTAFAEVPDVLHGMSARRDTDLEVLYVDSTELAAHLRRRFAQLARQSKRASHDPHSSLEIPVIVFNLDRDVPILIDEHYNARALEDMVLIAENAANQDEHPTGFMCEGALLSRPLSPMRHALAATLQHLGGVLPPHLGYHPHRKAITHNWLWSVGAHPLSWTSTGTAYSQLHIDALHRSYILDALDASVEAVNAGVALLADEKPTPASYKRVLGVQDKLREALQLYSQAVGVWRTAVAHASSLEFGFAAENIEAMERTAAAFYAACVRIEDHLHPKRCAEKVPIAPALLRGLVIGSAAAVGLTLLLTCALPRKKSKRV